MLTATRDAESLRQEIRRHDHLYYNLQQPEIADAEYDALFADLKRLEAREPGPPPANSPTQRVGGVVSSRFDTVSHDPPMLSLGNAFSADEFLAWHERTARSLGQRRFPMTAELKIDGLAIQLDYDDGQFTRAATRGDGITGEDVTHTVRTVRTLPLQLAQARPGNLQVRGEIFMPNAAFDETNFQREDQGEDLYSNPRNAAAGTVRQLDPAVASERQLRLWVYSLNHSDAPTGNSHWNNLDVLRDLGFPVNPQRIHTDSRNEVIEYCRRMESLRHHLGYDTDGIVVKVDDLESQGFLGNTGHEPRWAVAWKFPASRAITRLKGIFISVGRFGKLTPVADLEPVSIEGVVIANASLHNEDDLRRKDIRAGEEVIVERAGGVIPQVIAPVNSDPDRPFPVFHMPSHCPECGQPVKREGDGSAHWCVNPACRARSLGGLKHLVSKSAMDIDGMGPVICEQLIDAGLVDNPGDVFKITQEQLAPLPRMGVRSAARVHRNIQEARTRPLQRILYSLGIFRLGRHVSKQMAKVCRSLDEAAAMPREQLLMLDGVNDKIADCVLDGFRSPQTQQIIRSLQEAGVTAPQEQKESQMTNSTEQPLPLQGMRICVTGKLSQMTRDDAHSMIVRSGGVPASSVSKSTNVLVVGDKPGSKLAKASNLNIEVWGEADFISRVNGVVEQQVSDPGENTHAPRLF